LFFINKLLHLLFGLNLLGRRCRRGDRVILNMIPSINVSKSSKNIEDSQKPEHGILLCDMNSCSSGVETGLNNNCLKNRKSGSNKVKDVEISRSLDTHKVSNSDHSDC